VSDSQQLVDSSKDKQTHAVTASQAQTIFEMVEDGASLRLAAEKAGVSRQTAWRLMRSYEANTEAAVKYMALKALERVEDWDTAARKAADKGDHRPAKDWLLHVKAIEPVEDTGRQGLNVAIMIGTPDAPIRLQPPDVVVSPSESE
jgi:hypothetical protein